MEGGASIRRLLTYLAVRHLHPVSKQDTTQEDVLPWTGVGNRQDLCNDVCVDVVHGITHLYRTSNLLT